MIFVREIARTLILLMGGYQQKVLGWISETEKRNESVPNKTRKKETGENDYIEQAMMSVSLCKVERAKVVEGHKE